MIFKGKITETNKNTLPLIINSRNDFNEESQNKIMNTAPTIPNSYNDNLTIDIKYLNNNLNNFQEDSEKEKNNDIEEQKEIQNKAQTISNSRIIGQENIFEKVNKPFISKVILENVRSKKDCVYLLENFLRMNNIKCNYEIKYEQDKMIYSFDDEETALEFSKIIYNEKIKNSLYKNVLVHLRLLPNNIYLKRQKTKDKKLKTA